MLYVAMILALALPRADEKALVAQLGAPKFADREKAERELTRRMTYAMSLRMARAPTPNAESRRRVELMVRAQWSGNYPDISDWRTLPAISCLSEGPNPFTCPGWASTRFWRSLPGSERHRGLYIEYYIATQAWLGYMIANHLPAPLVRAVLWHMRMCDARMRLSRAYLHEGGMIGP